MAWILVLTLAATLLGGGGVAYASDTALPGDMLYPVKMTVEDVRLGLANDAGDMDLLFGAVEARLAEIDALIGRGRPDDMQVAAQLFDEQLQELLQVQARTQVQDGERLQLMIQECEQLMIKLQQGEPGENAVAMQLRYILRQNMPEDKEPSGPEGGNAGESQKPDDAGMPPEDKGPQEPKKPDDPGEGLAPGNGANNGDDNGNNGG
ncbi:MAG TPA: hypothetical protein DEH22_06445, partial [Chloroflexi bacterium]|nr:hypothetical protein [Chloroflexota bacterium]